MSYYDSIKYCTKHWVTTALSPRLCAKAMRRGISYSDSLSLSLPLFSFGLVFAVKAVFLTDTRF